MLAGDALRGVRVVDLSTGMAGPLAAMELADFGASVVRVDQPPDGLDPGAMVWHRGKTYLDPASDVSLLLADADGMHLVPTPLVGRMHVTNIAAAWATGRLLGVPAPDVLAGLAAVAAPPGRNTVLRAPGAPLVVVDYAHTPGALGLALETARELTEPGGRRRPMSWSTVGRMLLAGHPPVI